MRMQMFKVVDRPDHEWQLKNMHALTSSDFHQNIIYPIILSRIYCHFVAPKIKYVELAHVESAYAHDVSNVSIIRSATPKPIQQFIFVSKSKLNIYSSIIVEFRYPLCAAQRQRHTLMHLTKTANINKLICTYFRVESIQIFICSWMHRCSWVVMIAKSFRCVSPNKFISCQKEQYLYLFRGVLFLPFVVFFFSLSVHNNRVGHASRFISSCDLFMYSSFRSLYQSSRS